MRFSFFNVLSQWSSIRDQHKWALGAIFQTQGSVYRKTGALMLFSDAGHQLGLLSGGCLESDLLLQARKVIAFNDSKKLSYDAQDEDNIAWKLGIGCGGRADIVLHPCHVDNDYLGLNAVFRFLDQGHAVNYALALDCDEAHTQVANRDFSKRVTGRQEHDRLRILINPQPCLLISGGGADIVAIADLANRLGWRILIIAKKMRDIQKHNQPTDVRIYSSFDEVRPQLNNIDAAIVANHDLDRDADAVDALADSSAAYIGLLGPEHRKIEVLSRSKRHLSVPLAGPMGLALGGDLPESIALSVIAECHAVLFGSDAKPLSKAYF